MEAHRVAHQYGLIGPSVEQPQYNLLERNKVENEFLMIFKTVGMGTTILESAGIRFTQWKIQ